MNVRYTPRAFADIENIRAYISQFNPAAGNRIVTVLQKVIAGLGDFPESGKLADERGVRIMFAIRYPYRIYYRLTSDEVIVLHVRHAARKPLEQGDL
jgi:plasmid stabilization system protein ParE